MVRPRLKGAAWERDGEQLRLIYDFRSHFTLTDPDGAVEALIDLLSKGGRTIEELGVELRSRGRAASVDEIAAAVEALDEHGLVEDDNRLGRLDAAGRERHFSNLAFFESFATLACSREDIQQMLRDAHVLILGAGGLSCNVIQHLCGLGIGRLTVVDRDVVEIRNFARQYLYRHRGLGRRKVEAVAEWVKAFDPTIDISVVDTAIRSESDIGELMDRDPPHAVVAGIDSPADIDQWVNASCVRRDVPYVRGGTHVTQAVIYSVDPGRSACMVCGRTAPDRTDDDSGEAREIASAVSLLADQPATNRGIGPVMGLLGALCAFELLRFITRIEPPAYAGQPLWIDLSHGCAMSQPSVWQPNPRCPVCGGLQLEGR